MKLRKKCLIINNFQSKLFSVEHLLPALVDITENHLISATSKLGDFKKLTYWRSLVLADSQFNAL